MNKTTILPALFSAAISMPLLSQADFEIALARHKGNKIVLLVVRTAEDMNKWRQIIDADGVYVHGFTLLNRDSFKPVFPGTARPRGIAEKDIDAFERWMRQKYSLGANFAWLALDLKNQLIAAGSKIPSAGRLKVTRTHALDLERMFLLQKVTEKY